MTAERGGPSDARSGQELPSFLGRAAAAGQDAQLAARRYRAQPLRLTDDDRTACAEDLAEAYAVGRLDDAEFGRRLDLLHTAVTHGDLGAVYDGLPAPTLYSPAPRRPATAPRRRTAAPGRAGGHGAGSPDPRSGWC